MHRFQSAHFTSQVAICSIRCNLLHSCLVQYRLLSAVLSSVHTHFAGFLIDLSGDVFRMMTWFQWQSDRNKKIYTPQTYFMWVKIKQATPGCGRSKIFQRETTHDQLSFFISDWVLVAVVQSIQALTGKCSSPNFKRTGRYGYLIYIILYIYIFDMIIVEISFMLILPFRYTLQ